MGICSGYRVKENHNKQNINFVSILKKWKINCLYILKGTLCEMRGTNMS